MTERILRKVSRLLRDRYGTPPLGNKRHPVSELIFIILSARTRGTEHEKAYKRLRKRFPSWQMAARARHSVIASAISPAGLEHIKANQIRALLRRIERDFGELELRSLHHTKTPDVEAYLISLPGVGLKTARCVMMYSLDRKVFPVDTHCLRLFENLGLIPHRLRMEKAQDPLQAMVPPDVRRVLHINAVAHGRETCRPLAPRCHECVISELCRNRRQQRGGT